MTMQHPPARHQDPAEGPAGRARTPSGPPWPRQDPITRLPLVILFPHSRCNCRCLMCDIWRAPTTHQLAPSDIDGWRDEWRALGVQRVVLSGGEPLLHSRLEELCVPWHAAGMGITLLSTGLLLRHHAAEVVRYSDEVVVSLDGPRQIHNRIRNVPRAYERLAEGVAAVKTMDSRVSVTGRCTVQRHNFRALRATVTAAHEVGLDRISFLAVDVHSQAFNRPEGWDSERVRQVVLEAEDLPILAAELEALEHEYAADFARGYIAESPLKLHRRLLQYFAARLGHNRFHPHECNAPWVSTTLEGDGTVRPCFFHPPLGNLYQAGSLRAVLNSPSAREFRRNLDPHTHPTCRQCVCTLNLRQEGKTESSCPTRP